MGRPFASVSDFLTNYARLLAELSQARTGELHIHNLGRVILWRAGEEISLDWMSERGEGQASDGARKLEPAPQPLSGATPSAVVPVVYADAAMGDLRLTWDEGGGSDLSAYLIDCARQLAFMVKRYEVSDWAGQRLGRSLLLVVRSSLYGFEGTVASHQPKGLRSALSFFNAPIRDGSYSVVKREGVTAGCGGNTSADARSI